MPDYDRYQSTPVLQQYMRQGQYAPMQGQYAQQSQFTIPQGQYSTPQGLPAVADIQQYIYPANLPEALKLISDAVAGEREDRLFYEYLISTAPTEEDKEIIRGIRDNEMRHFALFNLLFYQLTGQVLPPPEEMPFTPPASYCEGLAKALIGEENAVVRYRKILFAMQNRVHINILVEIITDELRHGTLYSYLYAKNNCRV